jgi:hypothetical protein
VLSKELQGLTPKAQYIKGKWDILEFIKVKTFCSMKYSVKKGKRKFPKWKKIFVNHIADKELCQINFLKDI